MYNIMLLDVYTDIRIGLAAFFIPIAYSFLFSGRGPSSVSYYQRAKWLK